jgi:hypothetical protein
MNERQQAIQDARPSGASIRQQVSAYAGFSAAHEALDVLSDAVVTRRNQ